MRVRKTLPRNLRKRSFRVGYVFAFSFIGIALGFILAHVTPTSTEFQAPSPIWGNHGPEHSDGRAILESTDTNPWMSSPGEEEAADLEASIADAVYRRIEEPGPGGDALASLLYDFTRITPEDIPPALSIQAFAAHVAAIATKEIWAARETASLPEDLAVTDIRFGTSPRPSESTESPRTRFSAYDTRIFAVFDTSTYAHPSVLLKWCRIDQPELLILQKYEIEPHAGSSYVWYKKKEGWPAGQYRVEVYSLGESFRMMSSGQYEVWQN
jgi:hypothetical protein